MVIGDQALVTRGSAHERGLCTARTSGAFSNPRPGCRYREPRIEITSTKERGDWAPPLAPPAVYFAAGPMAATKALQGTGLP